MITYKVKHGDTLYTIAHHFGICAGMLAMSNNIFGPHQISEGQELLVPIGISNKDLNFRMQFKLIQKYTAKIQNTFKNFFISLNGVQIDSISRCICQIFFRDSL
ncbi:LysM domain-containing protein [Clostridium sp. 001]|uniref:LysM peptidoglycan-binding domain-containing protein n=1 Tax=Clostridium sp. 001 TaxID=1970093 RepID=UPI001C776449|nr:LysM domain-containing protein [Clostridium sp. 001]QXE17483.1 hypothetical protein B5S50_00690 [Clostridium sp. 001]